MAMFSEATMSVANQEKIIRCPFCNEPVDHNKEQDYYKCPECGCEIWPEEQAGQPENNDRFVGLWEGYAEDIHRPHKPGSSNRSSGRKKAKKNIPLYTERYSLY